MEHVNPWPDIRARARVVHALACGGASLLELARMAGNDPVVVIAALTYDETSPRDNPLVPREVVVHRLQRLVRAMSMQAA